jgi:hypothetical protein
MPKEIPMVVPAEASQILLVRVIAKGEPRELSEAVDLFTDYPGQSSVQLTITGSIRAASTSGNDRESREVAP